MTDRLTVDDIVTGRAAEELGPGVIPTRAILIVETVSEEGDGLRYILSAGTKTWQALGPLHSVTAAIAAADLADWAGDDDID